MTCIALLNAHLFFLQEAMFLKNIAGPPSLQWPLKDLWKHRSLHHVGGRSPFVVCGRAWLLVSLFVRSLESTRMECHGDPQLAFRTKIGWWWSFFFWGGQFFSLFASTNFGGIFMTWLYISHVFLELTPYFAENSRASSSTHSRTSSIPNDSFASWWRSAIFLDHYFKVSNHQKRIEKA